MSSRCLFAVRSGMTAQGRCPSGTATSARAPGRSPAATTDGPSVTAAQRASSVDLIGSGREMQPCKRLCSRL
eukprot:scaffold25518_cov31-Prasinocladus_malaysianus.AAC.1